MKKQIIRVLSMALVISLILVCFSGCKKRVSTTVTSEVVEENGNATVNSTDESAVESGSSVKTDSTASKGGSSSTKKLAGTTVTYATWKDPSLNEDGIVVKSFEKKYNMKVKIDLIPQEKYIEILSSRIALPVLHAWNRHAREP